MEAGQMFQCFMQFCVAAIGYTFHEASATPSSPSKLPMPRRLVPGGLEQRVHPKTPAPRSRTTVQLGWVAGKLLLPGARACDE